MSDEVELPAEVDESERGAWEAWLANGNDADSAEDFRDAYAGIWTTAGEYCESMFEESEFDNVWYYIDWDVMARDWQLNGDMWTEETVDGVHIFRNY